MALQLPQRDRLSRLRDAGVAIWLDTLSRELLDTAGVRAFCDSYRELLACIDGKLADGWLTARSRLRRSTVPLSGTPPMAAALAAAILAHGRHPAQPPCGSA